MSYATLDRLLQQLRLEAWLGLMAATLTLTALAAHVYLLSPGLKRFRESALKGLDFRAENEILRRQNLVDCRVDFFLDRLVLGLQIEKRDCHTLIPFTGYS